MKHVLIYGAGGHAKVVVDIVEEAGVFQIQGILDDDPKKRGQMFQGYPILGGRDVLDDPRIQDSLLLIAIGDNGAREAVAGGLPQRFRKFATAVHPHAHLARRVEIGDGTVIMAGVVINPDVSIGEHVIINTGASIDHDCTIEAFAHISPRACLAGDAAIRRGAHVGIGASIIPGVRVGRGAIVGAGAVVINDVADGATVVGVPAISRSASKS